MPSLTYHPQYFYPLAAAVYVYQGCGIGYLWIWDEKRLSALCLCEDINIQPTGKQPEEGENGRTRLWFQNSDVMARMSSHKNKMWAKRVGSFPVGRRSCSRLYFWVGLESHWMGKRIPICSNFKGFIVLIWTELNFLLLLIVFLSEGCLCLFIDFAIIWGGFQESNYDINHFEI